MHLPWLAVAEVAGAVARKTRDASLALRVGNKLRLFRCWSSMDWTKRWPTMRQHWRRVAFFADQTRFMPRSPSSLAAC